ncbi:MAG: ATP-binding protein [Treponema sp.]|nr:ATP-binding protein [Treponema sp.]
MGASIVDIKNFGDALRSSGYKDIESAVSEIIDNSVEAEAKDVFVILKDEVNPVSGKKNISEIGFLDNGIGMNADILGKCLGLGVSTRQERKGMGRFGVGLPQASLYACPEVYVYSWQNGIENAKFVYLNINQVKSGEQTEIPDPKPCEVPDFYKYYISWQNLMEHFDFSEHGTLVIWKNCDRVQPKTIPALKSRLEFSIGQKFRHYIHDKKSAIKIFNAGNKDDFTSVFPNDPLFLMNDNYALGNPEKPKELFERGNGESLEPIFEPYTTEVNKTGERLLNIKYLSKDGSIKTSEVKIRYSVVKNKFYDQTAIENDPGRYAIGKYAKRLEGVSIVRAGREIDFRKFDFYENVNEPEHRWWGCEILFNPELDEIFGVSNNKQYVELKKLETQDFDDSNEIQPIWNILSEEVSATISDMYKRNKEIRKSSRSLAENAIPASTQVANIVEENADDNQDTETANIRKITPVEQLEQAGEKVLIEDVGVEQPTKDEIYRFLNNSVNFVYKDIGKFGPAFDYSFSLGTSVITINIAHKFYTSFFEKVSEDSNSKTTFELFLAAFVQAVNKTNPQQRDENDRLISTWLKRLDDYIDEQLNPSKE